MDNKDNQKRDIALEFLNSMEIIAQAQIDKTKRFDQTIVCTIVDDSDADKGKYKVSNGSATFIAYGNDQYTKDTSVMVTIPLGDYDQQKMIIGRYTTDENEIYNYVKPFAHLLDITGNINFKNDSGRSSVGFYANGAALAGYNYKNDNERRALGGPKHAGFWSALQEDEGRYYNPLLGYETFGLKADFTSFLREYNCIQGKYGLRAYVFSYNPEEEGLTELREAYNETPANLTTVFDRLAVLNTMSQSHKIQCSIFDFNTDEMNGDVYDFDIGYEQEAIFDISKLGSILHIEVLFYQSDNFAYKTDMPDDPTTPDEREDLHFIDYRDEELGILMLPGENLKVSNVYFCIGYNKEHFTGDKLILYTEDDLTYVDDRVDGNNDYLGKQGQKKTVKAKWIHLNNSGNIEIYSADQNLRDFDGVSSLRLHKVDGRWYKLEWYEYVLSQQSQHSYSGLSWQYFDINTTSTTYQDNFVFDFIPDFDVSDKKIKACLVPYDKDVNNNFIIDEKSVLVSNIITFTNQKEVISEGVKQIFNQEDFYLVNHDEHDTFNYFYYGNDDKIIQVIGASSDFDELGNPIYTDKIQKPEERIRRIDCYFKGTNLTLDHSQFNISYIKWTFPQGNTMIKPCDVDGNFVNTGVIIGNLENGNSNVDELHPNIITNNDNLDYLCRYYKISDYYHNTWTNNVVECEIVIDRVKYKAAITMHFGPQSSNGSDYTLVPYFLKYYSVGNTQFEKAPNALPIQDADSLIHVGLNIYDQNNNLMPWENDSLMGNVTVNWEPFYHTTYDMADSFIAYVPVIGQNIPDSRIKEVVENGVKVKKISNSDYKYYIIEDRPINFTEVRGEDDVTKYYVQTYYKVSVTEKDYVSDKLYVKRPQYFSKDNSIEYDKTIRYYTLTQYTENSYIEGALYKQDSENNDIYSLVSSSEEFSDSGTYYQFIEATSHTDNEEYYLPRNKEGQYVKDSSGYNAKEEYYVRGYKYSNKYVSGYTYNLVESNITSNNSITYNPFNIYYTTTVGRINRSKQAITPTQDSDNKWLCHVRFKHTDANNNNLDLKDCMQELLVLKIIVRNLAPYDLEAYFPIPLSLNNNISAYAGPEFIRYNSAGYVGTYRDPITVQFKQDVFDTVEPKLFIPQQKFLEGNDTWDSYTDGRNYGQLNEDKGIYNPPSVYLQDEDPLCCGIQICESATTQQPELIPELSNVYIPITFSNNDDYQDYEDNIYMLNYWGTDNSNWNNVEPLRLSSQHIIDKDHLKLFRSADSGNVELGEILSININDNQSNILANRWYYTKVYPIDNQPVLGNKVCFHPKYCRTINNETIIFLLETVRPKSISESQFAPLHNNTDITEIHLIELNLSTKQAIVDGVATNNFEFHTSSDHRYRYDYYIYPYDMVLVENKSTYAYNHIAQPYHGFPPYFTYSYANSFFTLDNNPNVIRKTYWTQPLVFYQNEYPNGTVNKWDGETFEINEQAGTILSHAIVAGKKNDDNTFSGVMLGALEYFDKVERSLIEQTGIYGFHHGAQSYAFKEDGTAFIGKAGHGRIYFDGNRGTIQSETWTEQQQAGMQIDLDDGIIKMIKPSSSQVTQQLLGHLTEDKFNIYKARALEDPDTYTLNCTWTEENVMPEESLSDPFSITYNNNTAILTDLISSNEMLEDSTELYHLFKEIMVHHIDHVANPRYTYIRDRNQIDVIIDENTSIDAQTAKIISNQNKWMNLYGDKYYVFNLRTNNNYSMTYIENNEVQNGSSNWWQDNQANKIIIGVKREFNENETIRFSNYSLNTFQNNFTVLTGEDQYIATTQDPNDPNSSTFTNHPYGIIIIDINDIKDLLTPVSKADVRNFFYINLGNDTYQYIKYEDPDTSIINEYNTLHQIYQLIDLNENNPDGYSTAAIIQEIENDYTNNNRIISILQDYNIYNTYTHYRIILPGEEDTATNVQRTASVQETTLWRSDGEYTFITNTPATPPYTIQLDSSLNNEIPFSVGLLSKIAEQRNFYITWDGIVHAQGGYFKGTINAYDGTIGGWIITNSQIYNNDEKIILDADEGIILDDAVIKVRSNNEVGAIGAMTSANNSGNAGILIGLMDNNYGSSSTNISLVGGTRPHIGLIEKPVNMLIYEDEISFNNIDINKIFISGTSLENIITRIAYNVADDLISESNNNNNNSSSSGGV